MYYLSHRGVVREDHDTTKLRIVFDASAKLRNELSLNDILYRGPCLLPYLYDILLRFRTGKIGLVGDIKQAFLQVEIAEEHRDFVRFLWFKDINETPRKITSLRFTRVVFGLTSSPFLLKGTIKIHVSKCLPVSHYTDVVKKLILNLYVDDSTNSFDTVETAMEFYEKSKSCLKETNFDLRKWVTNSFELKKFIDSNENNSQSEMYISDSETYVANLYVSSSVYRKVLGLNWDTGANDFIFDFGNISRKAEKLDITKRNILRVAAMFYDPLGLISPTT